MEHSFIKDGVVVSVLICDESFAEEYSRQNNYTYIHYKRKPFDAHMGWHQEQDGTFRDPNPPIDNFVEVGLPQPESTGMKEI